LYETLSQLAPAHSAWFVMMFFAMPIIMHIKPTPRFKGKDICPTCGYSLAGLELNTICPECGFTRSNSA
jgi:hypothetical protein